MPISTLPFAASHDRYLVYKILGKRVSFNLNGTDSKIIGIAERVYRDIFENMIDIVVGGNLFRFKEPNVISHDPENKQIIIFVYGKDNNENDMSDNALFDEVRASLFKGETIDDVITRTAPSKTKIIRFNISEPHML